MNLKRFLPDFFVQSVYVNAGANFGDAVSYLLDIFPGDGKNFSGLIKKWLVWEDEYSRLGYRTISLDDFIDYGGYEKPLENLGQRREENEEPVLHALIYIDRLTHAPAPIKMKQVK